MQSFSWKFYWVWPLVHSKIIPDVMFVAVIFIALLITLNCPCCPMLNSIQFALQSWEQYILEGLYILPWVVSWLMLSLIHSFIDVMWLKSFIYRSFPVHFDKNRFLNWFEIGLLVKMVLSPMCVECLPVFQEYSLFVSMLPGLKLVQLIWAAARGKHKWQDDICNWTINFISGIFYRIRDDTLQTRYNLFGCLAWRVVSMLLALKLDQLIRAAAWGKHVIHTYIDRNTVHINRKTGLQYGIQFQF